MRCVAVALAAALAAALPAEAAVYPREAAARYPGTEWRAMYLSAVSRFAHTVCWFNPRYAPWQCAWVADRVLRYSFGHGVDPRFVMAVIAVESRFEHRSISRAGAVGFGQLMPGTAAGMGVDPRDPDQNLWATAAILARLARRYGRADLVAAAYNAGEGAVARYRGVPPYRETRRFVSAVIALYAYMRSHPAWDPFMIPPGTR